MAYLRRNPMKKSLAFTLALVALSCAKAQTVKVGSGSYTTAFPGTDVAGRNSYPQGVPYLIDSLKSKPVPTNDWWSAKLNNAHCSNLFNYPLTMKTTASGLVTSYIPWGVISDIEPIVVGVSGLNASAAYVAEYSDWLIALEWKSGGHRLQARTGMGMPFVYYQKDSADEVKITVNSGKVSINNEVVLIEDAYNGADFVIYGPRNCTWSKSGSTLTSDLDGHNYWSMLMLPSGRSSLANAIDSFQRYAYVEPINTHTEWSYTASSSQVSTTFSLEVQVHEGSDSLPLQGWLPHQWSHSSKGSSDYLSQSYKSIRGELKMLPTLDYQVSHTFRGILPTLPYVDYLSEGFDAAALQSKISDLQYEALSTWTDSYNEGQVMNRLIQTARIAHEMGNDEAVQAILKTVKSRLENWLTHQSPEVAFLFYYHKTYSTLIGYPAGHGQDGNINDHHFHWGYFIHAASFIEEFEPGWAQKYGAMVNLLVRDAASPDRQDTMFPFLRNFNPFAGHCWANGFASFPQGNDQESTSESMQFNSSLIHWGSITGNDAIRDLGIYLYCTEQSAIAEYWFDQKKRNLGPNQNYALVSRVWGNSHDNGTFWTNDIAASYGIELYPIHGGSFYLAHDSAYHRRLWNEMAKNTGILTHQANDNLWHDIYYQYLAYIDAPKAIQLYNANGQRNLKFGVSDAQTYHWLHSLNRLGRLQPQITANHPLAVAFNKDGQTIYTAKNYGADTLVVTFSDQYKLTVPPRRLVTSLDGDVQLSISSEFAQYYKGTDVSFQLDSISASIDSLRWMLNSKPVASQSVGPYAYSAANMPVGNYYMQAWAFKGGKVSLSNVLTVLVGEQWPYKRASRSIPGTIEIGHYDEFEGGRGQGISYVDFGAANLGNFRSTESVDASQDPTEGAILTWIEAGEWTEYTVNVAQDGLYSCQIRYANGNAQRGGLTILELDGKPLHSGVDFASTGNWETYQSVTIDNLSLQRGKRILRLNFQASGANLGRLKFTRTGDLPALLPLAHAGGNRTHGAAVDTLRLDGSLSQAGSLGYLNYEWSQVYGPNRLTLEGASSEKPLLKGLKEGVYKLRLRVYDSLNSDAQEVFVFVGDGQNVAPTIELASPVKNQAFIEGQRIAVQAAAEDLDGQIAFVEFSVAGQILRDSVAPYQWAQTWPAGSYEIFAWAADDSGATAYSDTLSFSVLSPVGDWVLERKAGALAVGADAGNLTWWSNSAGDVNTRACLFDDVYQIKADGSFQINMGTQTWLEGWQNNGKEACGTPVAPHDGTQAGTWAIDSLSGALLVQGQGQFMGLPKATNNGELGAGAVEPDMRGYNLKLTAQTLTAGINFGNGYWQFQFVRAQPSGAAVPSLESWTIFPNPAQQVLNIKGAFEPQWAILDATGRLLASGEGSSIDVSPLPSGPYLLRLQSGLQGQTQLWIKD